MMRGVRRVALVSLFAACSNALSHFDGAGITPSNNPIVDKYHSDWDIGSSVYVEHNIATHAVPGLVIGGILFFIFASYFANRWCGFCKCFTKCCKKKDPEAGLYRSRKSKKSKGSFKDAKKANKVAHPVVSAILRIVLVVLFMGVAAGIAIGCVGSTAFHTSLVSTLQKLEDKASDLNTTLGSVAYTLSHVNFNGTAIGIPAGNSTAPTGSPTAPAGNSTGPTDNPTGPTDKPTDSPTDKPTDKPSDPTGNSTGPTANPTTPAGNTGKRAISDNGNDDPTSGNNGTTSGDNPSPGPTLSPTTGPTPSPTPSPTTGPTTGPTPSINCTATPAYCYLDNDTISNMLDAGSSLIDDATTVYNKGTNLDGIRNMVTLATYFAVAFPLLLGVIGACTAKGKLAYTMSVFLPLGILGMWVVFSFHYTVFITNVDTCYAVDRFLVPPNNSSAEENASPLHFLFQCTNATSTSIDNALQYLEFAITETGNELLALNASDASTLDRQEQLAKQLADLTAANSSLYGMTGCAPVTELLNDVYTDLCGVMIESSLYLWQTQVSLAVGLTVTFFVGLLAEYRVARKRKDDGYNPLLNLNDDDE